MKFLEIFWKKSLEKPWKEFLAESGRVQSSKSQIKIIIIIIIINNGRNKFPGGNPAKLQEEAQMKPLWESQIEVLEESQRKLLKESEINLSKNLT